MSASLSCLPDNYASYKAEVLRILGRKCGWLDPVDREALFQDAVMVLLEKECSGDLETGAMEDHQVRAYLVRTAIHKALDEGKRAERRRTVSHDAEPLLQAVADEPTTDDALQKQFERARLDEILAEMPERRSAIIKLRFFFERTPTEIQRLLGISERAYRKELEAGMHDLAEQYALVRAGAWCERRRSSVLALVAGVAGPNRSRLARQHLRSCPGCASWAAGLRQGTRDAAAALPLPLVFAADQRARTVLDGLFAARDMIADAGWSVRQRTIDVIVRSDAATGGVVAGARPGAVTAAVTACLAIGGGAAYCVEAINPAPARSTGHAQRGQAVKEQPTSRASTQRAEIAAVVTPAPVRTKVTPTTPKPPSERSTRRVARDDEQAERRLERRQERRATAPEFGLEGSGVPVGASAAPPPAPAAPAPPPVSAGPPGEFDP